MHRDPGLYPDPDRFDPDRWLPERRTEIGRQAYIPFGAGNLRVHRRRVRLDGGDHRPRDDPREVAAATRARAHPQGGRVRRGPSGPRPDDRGAPPPDPRSDERRRRRPRPSGSAVGPSRRARAVEAARSLLAPAWKPPEIYPGYRDRVPICVVARTGCDRKECPRVLRRHHRDARTRQPEPPRRRRPQRRRRRPSRDIDRVLAAAARRGVRIALVVETHVHNDYVTGGLELARVTGAAYLVPADARVSFPHTPYGMPTGIRSTPSLELRALATPGHTPAPHCVRPGGRRHPRSPPSPAARC